MAKFESLGYCPYNAVASEIMDEGVDTRLHGLWDFIGSSFVCKRDDTSTPTNLDADALVRMLSKDPIAVDLLKKIIAYNPVCDMVNVKQVFNGACNMQRTCDITAILAKSEKPELVLFNTSKFAAVICKGESEQETVLYFWDLCSTWNS